MAQVENGMLHPLQFGEIVEVQVTGIAGYGAFVATDRGHRGLIHLSELADEWVPFGQVGEYLAEGERLLVKVVKANPEGYGFSAHGVTALARRYVQGAAAGAAVDEVAAAPAQAAAAAAARTAPTQGPAPDDAGGDGPPEPPTRARGRAHAPSAALAQAQSVDLWLRYVAEVSRHLFATSAAQERLRQLADEAGVFALGVAMGNRITAATLESLVLRELRTALGLRQVEATDHAVDRWLEKVDPAMTREEARQAICRAARAGSEVREATALVQHGDVILAVTERGAVATVYRREEGLTPALPEESLRVNGLPLGAIARVRASSSTSSARTAV